MAQSLGAGPFCFCFVVILPSLYGIDVSSDMCFNVSYISAKALGACDVSQLAKQELTCETVDDLPLPTLTVTNTIPLLFLLTILP